MLLASRRAAAQWRLLLLITGAVVVRERPVPSPAPLTGHLDKDPLASPTSYLVTQKNVSEGEVRVPGARCRKRKLKTKPNKSFPMPPPNQHGIGQEVSHGTRPAVKRSLRRARNRAQRDGWTFYRGRLLTISQLGGTSTDRALGPSRKQITPPTWPLTRTRRASVFSWNAGGMTTECYQELLTWLQLKQIDMTCIQDVRWTGDRTWRAGG